MRADPPNHFRLGPAQCLRNGFAHRLASTDDSGMNGMFLIPLGTEILRCVVSDQMGWGHVSVSLPHRCPTWDEMSFIKGVFWREDECAMQLHPPQNKHINFHPHCLHIWRPVEGTIPQPPKEFVGPG